MLIGMNKFKRKKGSIFRHIRGINEPTWQQVDNEMHDFVWIQHKILYFQNLHTDQLMGYQNADQNDSKHYLSTSQHTFSKYFNTSLFTYFLKSFLSLQMMVRKDA